jgi:hypothetical protein
MVKRELTVQHIPVEHSVLDVATASQHLRKKLSQEVVVRRLFEAKLPDIVEVDGKFLCITLKG